MSYTYIDEQTRYKNYFGEILEKAIINYYVNYYMDNSTKIYNKNNIKSVYNNIVNHLDYILISEIILCINVTIGSKAPITPDIENFKKDVNYISDQYPNKPCIGIFLSNTSPNITASSKIDNVNNLNFNKRVNHIKIVNINKDKLLDDFKLFLHSINIYTIENDNTSNMTENDEYGNLSDEEFDFN